MFLTSINDRPRANSPSGLLGKPLRAVACANGNNMNYKHGMCQTPEYRAWAAMITRCFNQKGPAFHHYGGRGIQVCDEWRHDFMAFYRHIGPRPSSEHSIDRIDNNGNYEPGNVRWATWLEQQANRRDNIWITYNGKKLHQNEWARQMGIDATTLTRRRRAGIAIDQEIIKKYHSKLTESQVYEIRQLLSEGKSLQFIARIYHVDSSHISRIKTGQYWKHLLFKNELPKKRLSATQPTERTDCGD